MVRRGNATGVLAVLAIVLVPVVPSASGDRPQGDGSPGHSGEQHGHSGEERGRGHQDENVAEQDAATQQEEAVAPPAPEAEAPSSAAAEQDEVAPSESSAGGGSQSLTGSSERGGRRPKQAQPAAGTAPEVPAPDVVAPVVEPAAPAATKVVPAPAAKPTKPARVRPAARRRGALARVRAIQVSTAVRRVIAQVQATPPATPTVTPPARPVATRVDKPKPHAPTEKQHDKAGGVFRVVPIVFNALSDSVAFVPPLVWGVLGGLIVAALGLLALAIVRDRHARALSRERETLIADLRAIEGAVVPALPEALGGLALSVTCSPASGPVAGGDFHDAFPLSRDRVAVIVGDVAGHGRQALADAQLVRHAVRAYLEAGLDPRGAIAMTGAVVAERDEPLFASVLVGVHDRSDGTLVYASAGHEPPVFVTEHGARLAPVSGWSPPLGAGLDTARRQTSLPLPEGSSVCLLTDGVTEARSEGERIGISRVISWLSALGPGAMSSDVVARLRAEADPDDDVTVCILRALTAPAANVPRIEEALVEGGDPSYLVRFLRDCGLPLADAEEAGAALAATPDGTRMIASVEIRGGRAVVELAPLRGATTELVG
jgi:hypothetical protein